MKEKQIDEMDCKKCLHYEACQNDFRNAKALSIYEDDYTEEQYFADTIDCDYYVNKNDYRKAADVVEVSHGEWIDKHCSVCSETQPYTARGNAFATTFYQVKTKFCPNCGAKMDGERRENEG